MTIENDPLRFFFEGKTDPRGMESTCPSCGVEGGAWCVSIGAFDSGPFPSKTSYRVGGLHESRIHARSEWNPNAGGGAWIPIDDRKLAEDGA